MAAPKKPSKKTKTVRSLAGVDASGKPPAPLVVLSLPNTIQRVKEIMGAQNGEDPSKIKNDSPVRRPGILLPRFSRALNTHFFPRPLNGIVGFPPAETVEGLGQRIKTQRDPQV